MTWRAEPKGPCLCGAHDCPSCGPAQGVYMCACGEYADDCPDYEEHMEEARERAAEQAIDAYEARRYEG